MGLFRKLIDSEYKELKRFEGIANKVMELDEFKEYNFTKKELLNALASIAAPVNKAIKKGQETLEDIAEWLWVVIQGDFCIVIIQAVFLLKIFYIETQTLYRRNENV